MRARAPRKKVLLDTHSFIIYLKLFLCWTLSNAQKWDRLIRPKDSPPLVILPGIFHRGDRTEDLTHKPA